MNTENTNVIEGLSLSGTVSQRSKKFIGEDKKEVVTYLVSTSSGYYFLDEFLPQSYYRVGDQISVPVINLQDQIGETVFSQFKNLPTVETGRIAEVFSEEKG